MAARVHGLTDEEVAALRADVAAGKTPRVRITGSQFGDEATGTVRRVGDPVVDGADFVTVRVKIKGVVDDLLFAPLELSRGRRGPGKPAAPAARVPVKSVAAKATAKAPTKPASAPATKLASAPPRKPARKAARRAVLVAPVSIVLSSVGASWTVSAQRGSRSVLKNVPVNPGVVSAIAALLDQPAVEDAVAAVNETSRAEAETRAEQLRAELAQIQAVLDSHRRP